MKKTETKAGGEVSLCPDFPRLVDAGAAGDAADTGIKNEASKAAAAFSISAGSALAAGFGADPPAGRN